MRVVVITPPEPIVSAEEAKRHLRLIEVDGDGNVLPNEEDDYIEALIAAAQQWIDGPGGWLGRCVGVQTLEVSGRPACWPDDRFPYPPFINVLADQSGVPEGCVRYRAGYETIPAPIKQALLLLIGQWYSFRSNVAEDGAPAEMPMAVEALLSTYRVWL